MPNAGSHLNIVSEDDELLRPASPMAPSPQDRPISAQTFGHDALPLPVETRSNKTSSRQSRNSLATLINALDQELRMPLPPPSAASEVTLFDLEHGDFDPEADGPLASSTPHESQRTKPKSKSRDIPPVPQIRDAQAVKASRRSSIRYIVSDENAPASPVVEVARSGSSGSTKSVVAQWGARAIRPLVPKSPKSKGKKKAMKLASPPGGGLRPLSLLQDRDINQERGVKPLSLGKKSGKAVVDENADPSGGLQLVKSKFKPLKLERSETTKERAALRAREVVPDVVVRPPSEVERDVLRYGW